MNSIIHRIEYLLASYDDDRSLHQRFADFAGIDDRLASEYLCGERPIPLGVLELLQTRHGVSVDWLIGEHSGPYLSLPEHEQEIEETITSLASRPSLLNLIGTLLNLEERLDDAAEKGNLVREMRRLAAIAEDRSTDMEKLFNPNSDKKYLPAIAGNIRKLIKHALARTAVKHQVPRSAYAGD